MADTVPPKHPSQRRRRNKPPVPPQTLAADAKADNIPDLPESLDWSEIERDYWRIIWTSPMSTQFIDADHPALMRLTRLAGRAATQQIGVAALSEMRQLEDRFGLSPLSRRRLQIDIAGKEETKTAEGSPDSRWLRVVGEES